MPGLVPDIHVDPRDKPGGDELEVRVIGYHDFFADSVEHGAAQLPAVALVARFAGGARVDHQYLADATNQLVVGVAVQHDIGVRLAKAFEMRVEGNGYIHAEGANGFAPLSIGKATRMSNAYFQSGNAAATPKDGVVNAPDGACAASIREVAGCFVS